MRYLQPDRLATLLVVLGLLVNGEAEQEKNPSEPPNRRDQAYQHSHPELPIPVSTHPGFRANGLDSRNFAGELRHEIDRGG